MIGVTVLPLYTAHIAFSMLYCLMLYLMALQVHSYLQLPGGRTGYLSELSSGAEVLVADAEGATRTALVGRVKIEQRPLVRRYAVLCAVSCAVLCCAVLCCAVLCCGCCALCAVLRFAVAAH